MAEVTFEKVRKVYPDGTVAVKELSLEIPDGELMVFVGPSGCGKTTALRMVAGLEEISDGEIRIGDEIVNKLPPRDRDVETLKARAWSAKRFGSSAISVPQYSQV